MDKPLTMVIKETQAKLINVCNESGLPLVILDLIMRGLYLETHSLAEKQSFEEELTYKKMIDANKEEDLKEGLVKS